MYTTQLNKDIYQQSWWDLSLEEFFLPENTHKTMDFGFYNVPSIYD